MVLILFIFLLNVVAIALTYYCLEDSDKKEKLIFIAVGIAIIYMLTSFVYGISTKDVELKEVSEIGKNLITFLFVPINAILVLPIIAKSYKKMKSGRIKSEHFRNRVVILGIVLVILLIIECSYFKDIQNGVVKIVQDSQNAENDKVVVLDKNEVDMNVVNSIIAGNNELDTNVIESNEIEVNSVTN